MSNPIANPLEADPFWKAVVDILTGGKKLRADSYLASLNAEDLELLRYCLSLPGTLAEQQQLAPKWRGGPRDGQAPGISTLSEIAAAIRESNMLSSLERQQMINASARERGLQLGLDSKLVDTLCAVMAEEALKRQAAGMADKSLGAAASALLKREDQLFEQKKFNEQMRKKVDAGLDEIAALFKRAPELLAEFNVLRGKLTQRLSE